MDASHSWEQLFETWPAEAPKTGIIVTSFQETIPFVDFLTTPGILAVERDRPDTIGARKVMISFGAIAAVKMTDVGGLDSLKQMGFC
ncbi:MAG: hypothetical protein KDA80_09640 [Planctomycetaceae bacterium]|nr:hypothetical protein [Planctomycetaceae bacterium]